jgi:GT2 family glycosyltransferase
VVELDMSTPFTAARARNAGVARLIEMVGDGVEFVQVIDGDCELARDFIEAALDAMEAYPRAAVVCGRRRERNRGASIYNALCDMEWDTPIGEAEACGGDALLRLAALREVGGYDDRVIAGEEPELCLRLRRRGWSVRRIDREMTLHDAALTRFSEWWKRAVRAGHAYAELFVMHRYWGREVRSVVVYALVVPALALGLSRLTLGLSLGLFATHGLLYFRVRRHRLVKGDSPGDAALYARFCVIAKYAHLLGLARYATNRILGRRPKIIEYKSPSQSAQGGGTKPVTT